MLFNFYPNLFINYIYYKIKYCFNLYLLLKIWNNINFEYIYNIIINRYIKYNQDKFEIIFV